MLQTEPPNISREAVLQVIAHQCGSAVDPFFTWFEAPRLTLVAEAIGSVVSGRAGARVLDFGYLRGLVPRTLLSFFNLDYHVIEHPEGVVFREPDVRTQADALGIRILPCALEDRPRLASLLNERGPFDVILLGEVIEHLDPTVCAAGLALAASALAPQGRIIITTPNAGGIANAVRLLVGKDPQEPPIGNAEMIQGHIHLWSAGLLERTCATFGLERDQLKYFHGLEGTQFANSNQTWRSAAYQLWQKTMFALATLVPRWRGFYVLSLRRR